MIETLKTAKDGEYWMLYNGEIVKIEDHSQRLGYLGMYPLRGNLINGTGGVSFTTNGEVYIGNTHPQDLSRKVNKEKDPEYFL